MEFFDRTFFLPPKTKIKKNPGGGGKKSSLRPAKFGEESLVKSHACSS